MANEENPGLVKASEAMMVEDWDRIKPPPPPLPLGRPIGQPPEVDWFMGLLFWLLGVACGVCTMFAIFSYLGLTE